jgi:hypothetical protein
MMLVYDHQTLSEFDHCESEKKKDEMIANNQSFSSSH